LNFQVFMAVIIQCAVFCVEFIAHIHCNQHKVTHPFTRLDAGDGNGIFIHVCDNTVSQPDVHTLNTHKGLHL
jgi:hypothetical protein